MYKYVCMDFELKTSTVINGSCRMSLDIDSGLKKVNTKEFDFSLYVYHVNIVLNRNPKVCR